MSLQVDLSTVLARTKGEPSMPFSALHSPWARGGCEGCTIPMSPYAHNIARFLLTAPAWHSAGHSPGWESPGNQLTITSPHQPPQPPHLHFPCSSRRPSPGHMLRIPEHPHLPRQWGVCTGYMCPGTSGTQGSQTCFLRQACSQGSLKLPSPGWISTPPKSPCLPWAHSAS